MATYYEIIKDNASERSELTKRQDEDVLLRNLDAYVMKDLDGKQFPGVVHVTLNRPKVMFNYIVSALSNTREQIVAETEEKDLDTDYIEDFRRMAFAAANARLQRRGDNEINPYFDEQSCIRGGATARCLFRMVDGILIPDITYWDYRYVNYETGVEGLEWASYGYGTKQKKASIEKEKWWQKSDKPIIDKEAEVVDVWDTEHNEIWVAGKKVFEQPHNFKWADGTEYTPVVIQGVPLGSMLADKDDIKNHNESVFFLIRTVIPELYRLISIIQTHNLLTIKRPVQTGLKEGAAAEPPDYEKVTAPGASSSADIGGGTKPIDLGAVTNAAVIALNIIDKALDDAGFSLDIFSAPLGSGVAIIQAKEGKDVIYLPRLRLKSLMKTALGDMFTAQVIQAGRAVEIGTPGHKRKFDTNKLEGQYEVTHQFSVKSLTTDAGLASLAAAYGSSMSEHTKRREIYQMDDPDGEERWLSYEEAGRLVPSIKLSRIAEDLIALEKDEEAKMVADFAGVQLEQLLSGTAEMPKPEEGKKPSQVVSLFGGGAGRGGRPQQPLAEEMK